MSTAPVGYSGTPLAKKLGIVSACRVLCINAPDDYKLWLAPLPKDVRFDTHIDANVDVVHLFEIQKAELVATLTALRTRVRDDAAVWVSWPKKTSKVVTNITEDTIRDIALPLGFVDVKVCAVSEVWSGLKLVIRQSLRKVQPPP
jgi:Protein of unknown function (DUF3052)